MQRALNTDAHIPPLAAAEFAALIDRLASVSPPRLALAVSGGPDSMAMAFCAKRWAEETSTNIIGFIVDHDLRAESPVEAEATQATLATLGIPAEILRWQHGPIAARLHVEARKARYQLLIDACHRHGIHHLLLAHQREDQAETILMRFAKGSGIDGLAGIATTSLMEDVHIWRPLLPVAKERLIATCKAANIPFVTDASNESDRFARGRLRRVMPLLATEGLTIDRLVDLGNRAAAAKEALDHVTALFLRASTAMDEAGTIRINLAEFNPLPRAIAERVLEACLQTIHREDYAPEHASVVTLREALQSDAIMPTRTLHGCLIAKSATTITLTREYVGVGATIIHPGETIIWDQRWRVTWTTSTAPLAGVGYIKPLGLPPHDTLDRLAPGLRQRLPQGRVRATLPSLWIGGVLTAVPPVTSGATDMPLHAQLLTTGLTAPLRG